MDLLEFRDYNDGIRHPWETSRLLIIISLISKYLQLENSPEILDVGSGDAYIANGIKDKIANSYIHCVDIEYTAEIRAQLAAIFPRISTYNFLDNVKIKKKRIDLVTLLDVIEHIKDDEAILKLIINQDYIDENTLFLITVPAFDFLFSHHDVTLRHYRRYNLKTLKQTIKHSNLDFIDGGYFYTTLLLPRLVNTMKDRICDEYQSENSQNLGNWNKGKIITSVFKTILYIDFLFGRLLKRLGFNLPGLSVYAICKPIETTKDRI